MKIHLSGAWLFLFAFVLSVSKDLKAQCGAGYIQAQLNWDFKDYLVSTGNYAASVSAARAATQRFTIGTTGVQIQYAGVITNNGEDATHTADAGDDLNFNAVPASGNLASITLTFDAEVANLIFSIYDIDTWQIVSVNAQNTLAANVTTALTVRSGTVLTVAGSPGFNPSASASNASVANTSHDGTIDVSIAGPVRTVTLSISNSGSVSSTPLFLSTITACVTGAFPANYRIISRPFTGMPSYILTVRDNEVYQLDPATGKAKPLFTDPGWTNLNGMAYDPHKRNLYYTYSLRASAPGGTAGTVTMFKYNLDTETISTFIADVNAAPLNMPTYEPGVTSASASFYNGSLYFGIESANSSRNSGRENTVWKIDFAADSITPIRSTQLYGTRVDSNISGTNTLIHDWSDIGITNGMMYDFDGARNDSMYYHYNMMTGTRTQFLPSGAGNIGPKQTAIDWQDNVYNMGGLPTGTPLTIGGYIVPYNYDGTVNNAQNQLVFTDPGPVYPTGSWGDCSEAFRPTCDFGDAPATYDPNPLSPAVHEQDANIRIGATWDREWLKRGVTGVEDVDDGISTLSFMPPGSGAYLTQVAVYNNKGVSATLIAWLDYNGNGVFDASEAITPITVPSSGAVQNFYLYWPSTPNSFTIGQSTYLRVRMTTGTMVAANATGYYEDGETEDYRILIDNYPLSVNLLSFNAKLINKDNVELSWATSGEANFIGFEVQRSADNSNWKTIGNVMAKGNGQSGSTNYFYNDVKPLTGKSFYRLKMNSGDGKNKNSETKTVTIEGLLNQIVIGPNPAADKIYISVNAFQNMNSEIVLLDLAGRKVYHQKIMLFKGANQLQVPISATIQNGMYILQLQVNEETLNDKIIINKN